MELASKSCVPCRGGVPSLKGKELEDLQKQVPEWGVIQEHHLRRVFTFPDFVSALAFVNKVGEIAEKEGHHPDIYLTWGKVEITIWTHKIDGLTESDFVLAAKIDKVQK
jgi:4a-hydroxytetrahydrobiopterin dehydratase